MVTNVTSLLKTVKSVEDEHSRGTRALESTIEAIGQEIRVSVCKIDFNLIPTPYSMPGFIHFLGNLMKNSKKIAENLENYSLTLRKTGQLLVSLCFMTY